MKKISLTLLAFIALLPLMAQTTATFDDLALPTDSFWNGSNSTGGFLDGHIYFNNNYNTSFSSWSGFSYSNKRDTTTAGYGNQYSCSAGSGAHGSAAYAVAYAGPTAGSTDAIARMTGSAQGQSVSGVYLTNSTFDYLSMKNGDAFAKKFGGVTGMDSDWFRVTIGGWYHGSPVAHPLDIYLADFRSRDSTQHYILHTWMYVDLHSLGNVDSLYFTLSSSDTGSFGMNTPAYFCLDDFTTSDGAIHPVANNDTASVNYHDSVTVHILANDSLVAGAPYLVSITSGPRVPGASAYIDANNYLVYTPAIGIRTQDTVNYSLCDQTPSCSYAYVLINVLGDTNTAVNDIPVISLQLYPNPAHTLIAISSASTITHMCLIDMRGREVRSIDMAQLSAHIDIAGLESGLYTIVVQTSAGMTTGRFVKE